MDTGAKGGNRMLKDLVKANRSYRGYDESRCVTKEELLEMADCARLAASSVNRQPLQYYLAWEKDEVDKIQALTKWAKGLPELTLPHPHMCPTALLSSARIQSAASRWYGFRGMSGLWLRQFCLRRQRWDLAAV